MRDCAPPTANDTRCFLGAFGDLRHGDGEEAEGEGRVVEVDDAAGTEGEGESRVGDVLAVVEGGGERGQVEE